MGIYIKYFGQLAETTNCEEEVFEYDNISLVELQNKLTNKYPGFNDLLFAVFINNKKAANEQAIIKSEDKIAFMPPFAGG